MKKITFLLLAALYGTLLFAQDEKKIDVNINTNSGNNWYASPLGLGCRCRRIYLVTRSAHPGGSRRD
jgi:hypothetical protein